MIWTDEAVVRLRAMWKEGLSVSAIARELGDSSARNAVIGKVHRLGLAKRREPRRVSTVAKPKRAVTPVLQRVQSRAKATPAPTPVSAPAVAIEALPVIAARVRQRAASGPAVGPVRFVDRQSYQCSWISGDPKAEPRDQLLCCGLPVVGSPTRAWCAAHWDVGAVGVTPASRRERRLTSLYDGEAA